MKKKIYKDVKSFTIDRKKWIRGQGPGNPNNVLLRKRDDKKCCLGFYAIACGIPTKDIRGIIDPGAVKNNNPNIVWQSKLLDVAQLSDNSAICVELIHINDCVQPDDIKEKELEKEFNKMGVKVRFK